MPRGHGECDSVKILCHEADRPSPGTSVPVPRLTSLEPPGGSHARTLGRLQQPKDKQDTEIWRMVHLKRPVMFYRFESGGAAKLYGQMVGVRERAALKWRYLGLYRIRHRRQVLSQKWIPAHMHHISLQMMMMD